MSFLRRVRLFVRDYLRELPIVWSLARTSDCERSGGHRFGEWGEDRLMARVARECSRCGVSELARTSTGSSFPITIERLP